MFVAWMQFPVGMLLFYPPVKVWHISWYLGSIKDYKAFNDLHFAHAHLTKVTMNKPRNCQFWSQMPFKNHIKCFYQKSRTFEFFAPKMFLDPQKLCNSVQKLRISAKLLRINTEKLRNTIDELRIPTEKLRIITEKLRITSESVKES